MDAKQVWLAALERIQRRVSPGVFSTWFSGTIGLELQQHRLSVAVPSVFACDHLRQRFYELARVAASEVIGQSAEIAFVLREVARVPTASARQSRGHRHMRALARCASGPSIGEAKNSCLEGERHIQGTDPTAVAARHTGRTPSHTLLAAGTASFPTTVRRTTASRPRAASCRRRGAAAEYTQGREGSRKGGVK